MATIKIKRGTTDPTAAQVTNIGELAANTSTPKLFIKTASDSSTTPVWVGATIEASPGDWTSASKLATQSAINTTFMPKAGGAFTGDVTLNAQSDLRFADSDSTNWVAFQAPATVAANVTWTLPSADGSAGTVLSTNGSGTLSWASAGSATTVTTTSDNTNTTRYVVLSTSAQSGATLYVDDTTGPLSYNPSTAEMTLAGDLNVNGGDLKTTAATASLFDANATTLTIGAAATSMTLGASTATINLGSGSTGATINVKGNLTVEGTTTTINSTTLTVDDKNIEIGSVGVPTDTTADGGGITLRGLSDKTIIWYDNSTTGIPADAWNSSEHWNLASGKAYYINGNSVLNATTLGSGVTGSSLTSFGTSPTIVKPNITGSPNLGYTTTATAAGTTTLTVDSNYRQFFTGSTTQTVVLPVASTMTLGQSFEISNSSTGTLTVQSSGLNLVASVEGGKSVLITCILTSGTSAASWDIQFIGGRTSTGSGGALVYATSPSLTTPTLGVASATSVNKVTITAPATSATLTIADGKTLTASNTLTFTGTDSSSVAFGAGGTVAYLGTANAFTAANTFTNATGQTFRQAATQDGVILNGRAGGTTSLAVTITPTTLSSSRTYTLPDVDGTAITTGNLTAITATGTIASGTWNGTAIAAAYGGTGQTSYTVGDLVYASGATALSKLSSSATAGAVLASTGSAAAPEYKTISFTNGTVTSGTGTLTLAVQNAAADGTTKGIAAFNSTDFDAASGVITIDTVDGGTY